MDFGEVKFIRTKTLKNNLAVYKSVRKPGCVYKFFCHQKDNYRCSRCYELGVNRQVTIRNGRITGRKHPEDNHHPECEPVAEAVVEALALDREMRNEVQKSGKRCRQAYDEAVGSLPKRFRFVDLYLQPLAFCVALERY